MTASEALQNLKGVKDFTEVHRDNKLTMILNNVIGCN